MLSAMRLFATIALALGALLAGPARAALPFGTLEFVQPSGVVGANDTVPVWMRFTLSPNSAALNFSSDPLSGFAPSDIPMGQRYNPNTNQFEFVPFASVSQALIQSWYLCNASFFAGCSTPGEYSITWGGDEPGHPNPDGDTSYAMNPGDSVEYLLATLTPKANGAAPGTYELFTVGLQLRFQGLDDAGGLLYGYHALGVACGGNTSDCAFNRTVQGRVPEPSSLALAALGAWGVWRLRRRIVR